jgi:hypothetical protein
LPRAIAARLGPSDVRDCGELNLDASAQARNDARNCVLDALRGHRPFKLVQWQEATQHALTVGYVSAGGAAAISILRYDSDASAGKQTGATLAEARCGDLRPSSDCTIDANTLCLDCVPLIESSLECSQQLPPSDCHGTGNYEAGKGGEYRPCCAGLREVFQKIKLTNEAGNASCGDLPLRVYACVEGRCGDGRCEDAEAVPCGCALDCPSAAVLPR